jgi:hypothetical protein
VIALNVSIIIPLSFIALLSAYPLPAGQDVRGVSPEKEATGVIEQKCLVCHNRQRIDQAVRERREMEDVLGRMRGKGAVLSEKERSVMGHFWGKKIFREEKQGETKKDH